MRPAGRPGGPAGLAVRAGGTGGTGGTGGRATSACSVATAATSAASSSSYCDRSAIAFSCIACKWSRSPSSISADSSASAANISAWASSRAIAANLSSWAFHAATWRSWVARCCSRCFLPGRTRLPCESALGGGAAGGGGGTSPSLKGSGGGGRPPTHCGDCRTNRARPGCIVRNLCIQRMQMALLENSIHILPPGKQAISSCHRALPSASIHSCHGYQDRTTPCRPLSTCCTALPW